MNRQTQRIAALSHRRAFVCVLAIGVVLPLGKSQDAHAEKQASQIGSTSQGFSTQLVGFTAPVRQAAVAPLIAGRILKLPSLEGSTVTTGAPLIILDDSIQRARCEMVEADAASKLEVDLALVRRDQAQEELKRVEVLAHDGRASTKELLDAQARAEATRIEWHVAEHRQVQQERDAALQKQLLAQHTITAQFDGYISRIDKHEGETVEDLESVLVLTQLDPVEVTLDCPVELAARFREGATIAVTPSDAQWTPREGRIKWVSRVANAASQTVRIKLHVDNSDRGWLTGIKVSVEVPPDAQPRAEARPKSNMNAET